MLIMRTYSFRTNRKDSTGALFERVLSAIKICNISTKNIWFRLDSLDLQKKNANPFKRVIAKFPVFQDFYCEYVDISTTKMRALTNFNAKWINPHPNPPKAIIDPQELASIANGIPRSYPFFGACFVFDGISVLDYREKSSRGDVARPELDGGNCRPSVCV